VQPGLFRPAATHAICSEYYSQTPKYSFDATRSDLSIFGDIHSLPTKIYFENAKVKFNMFNKPTAYLGRRMGIVSAHTYAKHNSYCNNGYTKENIDLVKKLSKTYANSITVDEGIPPSVYELECWLHDYLEAHCYGDATDPLQSHTFDNIMLKWKEPNAQILFLQSKMKKNKYIC
jgi:hypothetical protein